MRRTVGNTTPSIPNQNRTLPGTPVRWVTLHNGVPSIQIARPLQLGLILPPQVSDLAARVVESRRLWHVFPATTGIHQIRILGPNRDKMGFSAGVLGPGQRELRATQTRRRWKYGRSTVPLVTDCPRYRGRRENGFCLRPARLTASRSRRGGACGRPS